MEEKKEFHLEEALKEIETIIESLESDDLPLKEAIALYGDGAKLLSACKEELSGIETEMIVIEEGLEES
ncbi:MAG: exodeoxyribonuclease VII small subunit [Lachnospiraceae bacterium]|nr:exodeoxyribonuclease VII small subunit [Lachnospiraceae bacterium]